MGEDAESKVWFCYETIGDFMKYPVNVVEMSRNPAVDKKPKSTVRIKDNSNEILICLRCDSEIIVTHWKDSRGEWPNVDPECPECHKNGLY